MKSRPIFPLFLTLSVVFILIGIVLVIFTQFDRGYVAIDSENGITIEQKELIKQISQAAARVNLNDSQIKKEIKTDSDVLTLIEQVKLDDTLSVSTENKKSQTLTDQEMARINHLNQQSDTVQKTAMPAPYSSNAYDDYQSYWLSNNPWSPDYNPNKRY
jgi:exopolysaccharide biosynthesis protein